MTDVVSANPGGGVPGRAGVTIGMPVYNGAPYIEQALAGVLGQTYKDFTLIVSDNASDDGTWDILESWAARDDRIVLHRQAANIGATANFRYVLDQCQTDYFMWHACDDWLQDRFLEALLGVFAQNPDCKLACASIEKVNAQGRGFASVAFPAPLPTGRLGRLRCQLVNSEPAWIYGLFNAKVLKEKQVWGMKFGHAWGADMVILVSFILDDEVCGTNEAGFFQRFTGLSSELYAPKSRLEKAAYHVRLFYFHYRILLTARLTVTEKLRSVPWVFKHAYRRPITMKTLVKKPLKRLFRRALAR